MIPKECKRLAEVDFPIAVVSKHAAREKSIRHGHPSTLHLWWARRPLAACRSMLMALLLPDPADPHCPAEFKREARRHLLALPGRPSRWDEQIKSEEGLRKCMLEFIGDFADWDRSADQSYLKCARGLVKAAHPEETPLVVDPFAGGGSIPLEALRLGCDAFASDLNPVACLINKVVLEDIPSHGPKLAAELRRVGDEIKRSVEKDLADFYPLDSDGAKPIAYLWARTVRCESPNCGAEIPLVRSFWLCKKSNRKRGLRYEIVRPKNTSPYLRFEVFDPKNDDDVPKATVNRANAVCPCCNTTLASARVRAQLGEQRGGAAVTFDKTGVRTGGALLLAVALVSNDESGRIYRLSSPRDYKAVWLASVRLSKEAAGEVSPYLMTVPNEPIHVDNRGNFWVVLYGPKVFGDLFTARQTLALSTLCSRIRAVPEDTPLATAVKRMLSCCLDKLADLSNTCCRWEPVAECPRQLFARQAIPLVWDIAEGVPLGESSGAFQIMLDRAVHVLSEIGSNWSKGHVDCADATESPLPDQSASVWFTDPPYYDAIAYAGLSDFFLVWLKRALPGEVLLRNRFEESNPLTSKVRECIQDGTVLPNGKCKDKAFFEQTISAAFTEGRRVLKEDGIGSVVFAHKTTEGWEALLSGMIKGGLVVTGSWPILTEMASRFRARESAALATSVHLVCRPRDETAAVGDWGEVLRELPLRVGDWIERLQEEGIRGADLVFACIGPALEIFSRYSKVETAEGREVGLPEYLEKVWEVVGRTALEQVLGTAEAKARNGAAGAVEEDARLTALFLWTLQSTNGEQSRDREGAVDEDTGEDTGATEEDDDEEESGSRKSTKGYSLIYDVVRRFAQPLGIHLEDWNGRIIETKKGVVRLLSVSERAKQLFGEDGASAVADRIESDARAARSAQMMLFPEADAPPRVRGRGRRGASASGRPASGATVSDEALRTRREATTLDRVHAAMLLQASGRANALRALLKAEMDRGPDFLRLSNALTALYPRDSEEKRLLDAMLLAVPR